MVSAPALPARQPRTTVSKELLKLPKPVIVFVFTLIVEATWPLCLNRCWINLFAA